ncbi:uncharacterized protein HMPREF1541_06811 [Cyphellophora europaea CBS 101466]|uniref:Alpha-galactosidase n=1 Tax=Cyphellophora europaea (strain CBS 101466) TaxID=1220924 RepID=W2RSQ3_CYPE1|nr:uncharacterized protein HMPREF1541_06811 [Cyphellophora europaea CBS 101466]ETN38773.1 hypothetical protein HMPREF1541_06811 [Cyphellophora europaea CBS 101466]
MGWDTYNAYGLAYNETTIRDNADRLVSLGFRDLGYDVVIFDDAMTERDRSANGSLVENQEKFPSGLHALSDELHALSLKYGVYSSAGRFTCGSYPGSLGYEQQDARWWADLGADYLKYDNCFNEGQAGTQKLSYDRYGAMANALNATGRNITYSLCNWGDDKVWEWGCTISNSARMSGDSNSFDQPSNGCPCDADEFYCQKFPGYQCSVLNILGKASYIAGRSGPGFWIDLDMLEVGNGGMTTAEYRTHFTMWSAIKSPLIMGNKLYDLSPEDYAILTNPAVIALNQDPGGSAIARRFVQQVDTKDRWGVGEIQVWQGSLWQGDQVVVFLNAANETQGLDVPLWRIFGTPGNELSLRSWDMYDLWAENVTMLADVARQVLNGTLELGPKTQGYYNASRISWREGLAANDTRLLGSFEGTVEAGGTVSAEVGAHDVKAWRFRLVGKNRLQKKDEL